MNQIVIGKFIAQKRKEQNLTQEQLAERLGVSNKTVSKWESGKCMPDYAVVKRLCEELRITVAELMDGKEAEEKSVGTVKTHTGIREAEKAVVWNNVNSNGYRVTGAFAYDRRL